MYTNEKNIQILIALMKENGIRQIVASPGTTNMTFVVSVQRDPFFVVYSSPDERSAAYIACGIAEESGEPVAISCTGATASRNYIPALTEAFYRKLPILAITASQNFNRIGHNYEQVIDRSVQLNDIVKKSVHIPVIKDTEDEWGANVAINDALLELSRNGGGPVHIDIVTSYSRDYSVKELPGTRVIKRLHIIDDFPCVENRSILIFVGSHKPWDEELNRYVDRFCEYYNSVVIYNHTSNYKGKYGILANIITRQYNYEFSQRSVDIIIHIGDVTGASPNIKAKEIWRVNPDGEIRDTFRKIHYIFEMEEKVFFHNYVKHEKEDINLSRYSSWKKEYDNIVSNIPDIPFSNVWIAHNMAPRLPENSSLHLGILNTLRVWSFFEISNSISSFSNTGGFGIDGCMSSLIGASLTNSNKLYYGIFGDLSFFYDINVLGNRHIGNNVRIMLINNGVGVEFKNNDHPASSLGGEEDLFVAAAGHYGNKSKELVKNYSENLGLKYISASNKEEFLKKASLFLDENVKQSILFEVFIKAEDESLALESIYRIRTNTKGIVKKIYKKTFS